MVGFYFYLMWNNFGGVRDDAGLFVGVSPDGKEWKESNVLFNFEQKKLKNFKDKVEFYSAIEGWFYDSVDQNGVVLIKTKKLAVSNKFEVKLKF
jgi:hypothetical protein